jgi:hypothetical protein
MSRILLVALGILAWLLLWHQLRLCQFDRTGTVSWSGTTLGRTFVFTVVPEVLLVCGYLFATRKQSEDRATSIRNPIFVTFVVLAVCVLFLGEWLVQI